MPLNIFLTITLDYPLPAIAPHSIPFIQHIIHLYSVLFLLTPCSLHYPCSYTHMNTSDVTQTCYFPAMSLSSDQILRAAGHSSPGLLYFTSHDLV